MAHPVYKSYLLLDPGQTNENVFLQKKEFRQAIFFTITQVVREEKANIGYTNTPTTHLNQFSLQPTELF